MSEQEVKKPSIFARVARSFRDMKGEMKKVVWPNKKQIVNNTLIVLAFVAVSGIFIFGLDSILSFAIKGLFSVV
ncbi:MAG: preprotein translocase subunit SecE [Angelakisella sp.]